MIRVDILIANETFNKGKNFTFTKGKEYYGRWSKRNDQYIVMSDEGFWCSFTSNNTLYCADFLRFNKLFTKKDKFYCKNRKELNAIINQ